MEYEILDAVELDTLIQGGTINRDKPPPRVVVPPKKEEEKKGRRILDALDGLPPKMEPGKA
jgi:hypothetical protein